MTAIADCGHPQEDKLMMLLCKQCEHWNQLEKVKELEKLLASSSAREAELKSKLATAYDQIDDREARYTKLLDEVIEAKGEAEGLRKEIEQIQEDKDWEIGRAKEFKEKIIDLERENQALKKYQTWWNNQEEMLDAMKASCVEKCGHQREFVCGYEDGTRHCLHCEAEKYWEIEKQEHHLLKTCLAHRCSKHYEVQQINTTEFSGAECGACIQAELSTLQSRAGKLVEALEVITGLNPFQERTGGLLESAIRIAKLALAEFKGEEA